MADFDAVLYDEAASTTYSDSADNDADVLLYDEAASTTYSDSADNDMDVSLEDLPQKTALFAGVNEGYQRPAR